MKFYPSDWRGDPRLRMCGLAARGLWIDLMAYMHEGEPYGHLMIDGLVPDLKGIASLVARPVAEVRKALAELEKKLVFSRGNNGEIISRRMVRDRDKALRDQTNGRNGGNPNLTRGVNPPDKAHIPDTRDQNKKEEREARAPVGDVSRETKPEREPLIPKEAVELAEAFLMAIGATRDYLGWHGLDYDAAVWVARGYDRSVVLATAASIAAKYQPLKSKSYFAACVVRACTEPIAPATQRPFQPARAEVIHVQPRPNSIVEAGRRRLAEFAAIQADLNRPGDSDPEGNAGDGAGNADVRLLSQGGSG
jgi:hypothetical protein